MKQTNRLIPYTVIFLSATILVIFAEWSVQSLFAFMPNEFWDEHQKALSLYIALTFLSPAAAALAVSYILLKVFQRHHLVTSQVWLPLFIVAGWSAFVTFNTYFAYFLYESVTFPSPEAYPGATVAQVWSEIGHGQYDVITYEYTVNISLERLKDYYSVEMPKYCAPGWEFVPTYLDCAEFVQCYTAQCEIPRPFVKDAQFFTVYLRTNSDTQTNVLYFVKDKTF